MLILARSYLKVLGLLGLVVATMVGVTDSVHAASKNPIKIGLIEPFSGPAAAIGTDLLQQWRYLVDRLNKAGGVLGGRKLEIVPLDNAMIAERTIQQLKSAIDQNIRIVSQGIGSNHAINIIKFLDKHNSRAPDKSVLYLNNSAITTAFTNSLCSFWHFRFDANVDMKVAALVEGIASSSKAKRIYLINQNYAYGKSFRSAARRLLKQRAPKAKVVGDDLIVPFGKVRDFTPYVAKIKDAAADTVLTGNWGADLVRLVKAAASAGLKVQFYTIYGGITSSLAGYGPKNGIAVGIRQVSEYHEGMDAPPRLAEIVDGYRKARKTSWYSDRFRILFEMLAKAIDEAGTVDPVKIGYALEGMTIDNGPMGKATMRAADHQILFPLVVSEITPRPRISFLYKGANFKIGWKTVAKVSAEKVTLSTSCRMKRPKR